MAKSSSTKSVSKTPSNQTSKAAPKKFDPLSVTDADTSVQDLFVSELKDTYWAENHLLKAIPKMVAAAGANDLQQALTVHLKITMTHASRLEKIFEILGEKVIAKKCDAMEGLTMTGEHIIENTVTGTQTRDLGIIMSGLKVENFEITTYKGLIEVANSLGKPDIAELLQQTLDEEIESSDILTNMSRSIIGSQPS